MKQVGLIQYYVSAMIFGCFGPAGGRQYSDLVKPEVHKKEHLENTGPDNVP